MDKLNSMTDKNLALKDKRYYEPVWKKAINRILVFFLTLVSWLPFPVIYFLSDLFYLLVKYGIKYRRKVIVENLTCAFPEKTAKEIQKLTNRYYRHFCDLSLEVIKLHSMSEKNIDKRVVFKGTDLMERIFDENKNMIVLAMHHNNWEWEVWYTEKRATPELWFTIPFAGTRLSSNFWSGREPVLVVFVYLFIKQHGQPPHLINWENQPHFGLGPTRRHLPIQNSGPSF
jgi:KDO2-lipid IV(A) lauroyltransferase